MRIFKKLAILSVLVVSFWLVEPITLVKSQTSCPARDQCLDNAYANYSQQVMYANIRHAECVQGATTSRNMCLDGADINRFMCEANADIDMLNNLARCSAIPDPIQAEYCVNELETIRQDALASCAAEFNSRVQECWYGFNDETSRVCDADFNEIINQALNFWELERNGCDIIPCE